MKKFPLNNENQVSSIYVFGKFDQQKIQCETVAKLLIAYIYIKYPLYFHRSQFSLLIFPIPFMDFCYIKFVFVIVLTLHFVFL